MSAVTLTPDDLKPFAEIDRDKAQAMIDDALALAAVIAPCILLDDFAYPEAAKAILRGAILRWNDSGSGALSAQAAGPYSMTVDTRSARKAMYQPAEIDALSSLCQASGAGTGRAFEIDTVPASSYGYWAAPDVWVPLPGSPVVTLPARVGPAPDPWRRVPRGVAP